MIGLIGSKSIDDVIIFEVSEHKIYNFQNFTRATKVRFAKNDVLQKKPVSEYVGSDLDTISLKIELKAELGVNPRDEVDKLIKLQRDGVIVSIILGGKPFGVYRWRISDISSVFERIDNKGNCFAINCDISFEEYV